MRLRKTIASTETPEKSTEGAKEMIAIAEAIATRCASMATTWPPMTAKDHPRTEVATIGMAAIEEVTTAGEGVTVGNHEAIAMTETKEATVAWIEDEVDTEEAIEAVLVVISVDEEVRWTVPPTEDVVACTEAACILADPRNNRLSLRVTSTLRVPMPSLTRKVLKRSSRRS